MDGEVETEEIKQPPKKKSGSEGFIKFMSIIIMLVIIGILIAIKIINPDVSTAAIILPIIGLGAIILLVVFWSRLTSPSKQKDTGSLDKLPDPITDEQAYEIVHKAMFTSRYADLIGEVISEGTQSIGSGMKSEVYHIYFIGKKSPRKKYLYVINKHFPMNKKLVRIFGGDKLLSDRFIRELKNSVSYSPEIGPDVEDITERNVLTGVERKIRTTSYPKKQKQRSQVQKTGELE